MSNKLLKAAAGTAGAALSLSSALGVLAYTQVFERDATIFKKVADKVNEKARSSREYPLGDTSSGSESWLSKQTMEQVELSNDRGQLLKGQILYAQERKVFLFCSHGYRSTGTNEFGKFAKFYHELGINILFVDHQAHGASDGSKIGFGYYEYQDGIKWLEYLNDRFGSEIDIFLHGISMGSATVMMMTGDTRLPENVRFTIADCGYTTATDEFVYNLKNWHVPTQPLLSVADFLCRVKAGYGFKQANPIDKIKLAKIPVLFVHGAADGFVPTRMAPELYNACGSKEKELLIIDGADHAESYKVDPVTYEKHIRQFICKYLPSFAQ